MRVSPFICKALRSHYKMFFFLISVKPDDSESVPGGEIFKYLNVPTANLLLTNVLTLRFRSGLNATT